MIAYCATHELMWVTKDWTAGTADAHVKQVLEQKVGAWWLRHETGRRQMRKREQLWIAARDIEGVLDTLDVGLGPVQLVSSIGRKAHVIQLPFIRPRRPAAVRPSPMSTRSGSARLFDDD